MAEPAQIVCTPTGHVAVCGECGESIPIKTRDRSLGPGRGYTTDYDVAAFEKHHEKEHG